jgi:hypothetical protein
MRVPNRSQQPRLCEAGIRQLVIWGGRHGSQFPFCVALPDLLKTAQPGMRSITGGGRKQQLRLGAPTVRQLRNRRQDSSQKSTNMFTKHAFGTWATENLEMDPLSQAGTVTIDLHAMTLSLE